ncbi:glycoside hydrolase family 25 protein [Prevotella sp.]|uniref:glycoside hydrolase family 25 protein n=1 Tax=Prevotella sp. TaxID=59823 RepID=UPI0039C0AEAD
MKQNVLARYLLITIVSLMSFALETRAQYYDIMCEDTCSHIHGIDISHYQGDVFWETVGENSKMAFVYIKATEGSAIIDARYKENIDLAHRYGLKVGSYHFYRAQIPQAEQLENFMAQCRPHEQDLIPMIDVERNSGMEPEELCDSLLKFLQLVEAAYHQKPIVYTYTNFYNKYLVGELNDYKLWIAQYSSSPPVLADGRDYLMWQYTGKGRINGINGYVDKNRFMGRHTMREIRFRRR